MFGTDNLAGKTTRIEPGMPGPTLPSVWIFVQNVVLAAMTAWAMGCDLEVDLAGSAMDAAKTEDSGHEAATTTESASCTKLFVQPSTCACLTISACDDGKEWTDDSCDPLTENCENVLKYNCPAEKYCNDGNACTYDCSDPVTGKCVFVGKSCDDLDICTTDYCDTATGECKHGLGAKDCGCGNSGNPCYESGCNGPLGECFLVPTCDDGNDCTEDPCEPGTGVCTFVPGPACKWCSNDVDCEDLDACTLDHCELPLGVCNNLKTDCDDGQCLTKDLCDGSSGGCAHIPIPMEELCAK